MSSVVFVSLFAAAFLSTEPEARPGGSAAAVVAEPVFDAASLAPHFAPGPLADAARELEAGRAAAALKLIPKDTTDTGARFLRASALVATNEMAEAAKVLEELGAKAGALRPRVDCLATTAYTAVGDLENALNHAAGCADDPVKGKLAKVDHARLLARLGKRDAAVAELLPFADATGWVRAEALFALAQVYEDGGKDAQALETLRMIYLDDPTSYLADKARNHAKELAKKLKAGPAAAARLADRADKLLQAGQLKAAISQLTEIVVPKLCEGAACEPKRCSALSPAHLPPETVTETSIDAVVSEVPDSLEKAAPPAGTFALAKAKDDEAAMSLALPACAVEAVAKPIDPVACRVHLLRGIAARKTRANTKALEIERMVYERCGETDTRARAAFTAASAAAALKDPDATALAAIAAFQFKEHTIADDALMIAANFARDAGDRKAERGYLRRLVTAYPDAEQRAEALFRLFWSHRAEGHPERGLAYLETLWKEYDAGPKSDGGDAERGRYWWGRTVAQNAVEADRPKGSEVLTTLARERPMTYYGLLARSYAGAMDAKWELPAMAEVPKGPLHPGLLAADKGFALATELWKLGQFKDAHDALMNVDFKALRADGRRGREATLLVLELLRDLGDDRTAHAYARRELLKSMRDATDPLARRASLVAFPLAFRGAIQENASKQGFAADFLQGLMREESALDPHAHSPVGARGLTQLMPATARAVAKSIGLKGFKVDKLWEPETNIQIGSVYLGRMLKTFGHPGLAAAAYNAGPGAVARWMANASNVFDEFVEDIPFSETRGYVKRVLRSYAAYSYLYQKDKVPGMKVSLAVRAPPDGTTQETGLR